MSLTRTSNGDSCTVWTGAEVSFEANVWVCFITSVNDIRALAWTQINSSLLSHDVTSLWMGLGVASVLRTCALHEPSLDFCRILVLEQQHSWGTAGCCYGRRESWQLLISEINRSWPKSFEICYKRANLGQTLVTDYVSLRLWIIWISYTSCGSMMLLGQIHDFSYLNFMPVISTMFMF